MVEKYFSQKCPKSISLDSGHLDKPFGPLIFNFFQYFLIFLDRFLVYVSGLGTRWTPSLRQTRWTALEAKTKEEVSIGEHQE